MDRVKVNFQHFGHCRQKIEGNIENSAKRRVMMKENGHHNYRQGDLRVSNRTD